MIQDQLLFVADCANYNRDHVVADCKCRFSLNFELSLDDISTSWLFHL